MTPAGSPRWRRWWAVYRLLIVAGAAAALWRLPWEDVARFWLAPDTVDESTRLIVGVLGLAACATGYLTVHYPGRSNVSLLLLPVTLAWWQVGGPMATILAGFGALFGNALRLAPARASVVGAARLVVATAAGLACVGALAGTARAAPLSPSWLVAGVAFTAVSSLLDGTLDWLDGCLQAAAHEGRWQWLAAPAPRQQTISPAERASLFSTHAVTMRPADPTARADVLTSLLLLPLAVVLQGVAGVFGVERLALALGGLVAMLVVVRASVNLRTLHSALRHLYDVIAEEREKLAALFVHSGEGIFTVDGDLRIGTVNPAMAALLGRGAGELEGQPCATVCGFKDEAGRRLCPDLCPLRRAHLEQRPISQEVVYQHGDQPPKHLLLTYATAGDPRGRLQLGIGIARDISVQKENERLREEFISLVTHELRSPLTVSVASIGMLARALQRGAAGQPLDFSRALVYADRVQGAEAHVLRLVDNLLELARVGRTDLPVEYGEVDAGALAADILEAIAPVAAAKEVEMRLERPAAVPAVWTSELYLREILSNLLSNAVKYSPAGARVTVSVQVPPAARSDPAAAPFEPRLEIAVADTGYGMSAEERARLFTRFFRSGRREVRRERGTGLGLALTKQMVERLGGTIAVESDLGTGSTFTVSLPMNTRPETAGAAGDAAPMAAGAR